MKNLKTRNHLITALTFCFIFVFGSSLFSQNSAEYHFRKGVKETCKAPAINADAVVYFDDKIVVHLELSKEETFWLLNPKTNDKVEVRSVGKELHLELDRLPGDYSLLGLDDCGQERHVFTFNGDRRPMEDIIRVERALFEAIGNELKVGEIPLTDDFYQFLVALEDVSYWSRMDYIQQYFFKNELLPSLRLGDWPDLNTSPVKTKMDGCNCEFTHLKTRDINPGSINVNEGILLPAMDTIHLPTAYNSDSGYSWWRKNTGPAKGHQLTNGGFTAGPTYREEVLNMLTDENGTETPDVTSPHMAELQYMLTCTRERVEIFCDCTKRIIFDYGYHTSLTARTELRGNLGLASRRAIAMTQDVAVATVEKSDGVHVLAAGDARREASCEADPNPDFWAGFTNIALTLGSIILNDSVVLPLSSDDLELVETLKGEIADLIGTPYWSENGCEGSTDAVPFTLFQTADEVLFSPNERVIFRLSSFTNQLVGGKRGWLSISDITSDFYIAALVKGGVWKGELDCCTSQLGMWLLASCDGGANAQHPVSAPYERDGLRKRVGSVLGIFGPWEELETVGGGFDNVVIKTDLGVVEERVGCDIDNLPYETPKRLLLPPVEEELTQVVNEKQSEIEDNENLLDVEMDVPTIPSTRLPYSTLEVYSLSGQLVFIQKMDMEAPETSQSLREDLQTRLPNGSYVLRFSNSMGEWESRKWINFK